MGKNVASPASVTNSRAAFFELGSICRPLPAYGSVGLRNFLQLGEFYHFGGISTACIFVSSMLQSTDRPFLSSNSRKYLCSGPTQSTISSGRYSKLGRHSKALPFLSYSFTKTGDYVVGPVISGSSSRRPMPSTVWVNWVTSGGHITSVSRDHQGYAHLGCIGNLYTVPGPATRNDFMGR